MNPLLSDEESGHCVLVEKEEKYDADLGPKCNFDLFPFLSQVRDSVRTQGKQQQQQQQASAPWF